jgi:hypothetical protein
MRFRFAISAAFAALSSVAFGQIPGVKLPGLDLGFKDKPAITTSLGDAVTELAFLDSYSPRHAAPLSILRRNADGSFKIFPGQFTFEAQSY